MADGSIYYFPRNDGSATKTITPFAGTAVSLDVGAYVWRVNSAGNIYYNYVDGSGSGTWPQLVSPTCPASGIVTKVSAGTTKVWALCTDGTVFSFPYNVGLSSSVTYWTQVGGSTKYADIDADHGLSLNFRCPSGGSDCLLNCPSNTEPFECSDNPKVFKATVTSNVLTLHQSSQVSVGFSSLSPTLVGTVLSMTANGVAVWIIRSYGGAQILWCYNRATPSWTAVSFPSGYSSFTKVDSDDFHVMLYTGGANIFAASSTSCSGNPEWIPVTNTGSIVMDIAAVHHKHMYGFNSASKTYYNVDAMYGWDAGTGYVVWRSLGIWAETPRMMDIGYDDTSEAAAIFVGTYSDKVYYKMGIDNTMNFYDSGFAGGIPAVIAVGRHYVYVSNTVGSLWKAALPERNIAGVTLTWFWVGTVGATTAEQQIAADW
jgi:hypothetical protein